MAIKSRKLHPDSTNKTNCSDCYPDCYYTCYPFPDFYNPPPPPPPLSGDQKHAISPFLIAIIGFSGGCILLFCYYILKLCARRRHAPPSAAEEEFATVDHPIWYIATVGLQQSVINSITVCKFKKGEGLIEGSECSVCLSEFQEEEMLRLLPKCSHAFHIRCVDTWLRSHTNCPLCRAHILTDIVVSNAANQEDEEAQLEVAGINGGLPENEVTSGERFENEGESDELQREVISKEGVESVDNDKSDETQQNLEPPLMSSEVVDSSAGEQCEGSLVIST